MARKPNPQTPPAEPIDLPGLPAVVDGLNQLAVYDHQREATVRAVADRLGYQLPADCADADLIQRDIAANMRRSVEACLEVGRGLLVLKEACERGQFTARLEVLGLEATVARRFMQAAVKFTDRATSRVLGAAGTQSKLLEMLVLDDEQIEELELTGQTGELALDDIATMSVKELRAALRESRQEHDAQANVAAKNAERALKLETELEKAQRTPVAQITLEAAEAAREEGRRQVEIEAARHAVDAAREAARAAAKDWRQALHAYFELTPPASNEHQALVGIMPSLIEQVRRELADLADEFSNLKIANQAATGQKPEWMDDEGWAELQRMPRNDAANA